MPDVKAWILKSEEATARRAQASVPWSPANSTSPPRHCMSPVGEEDRMEDRLCDEAGEGVLGLNLAAGQAPNVAAFVHNQTWPQMARSKLLP